MSNVLNSIMNIITSDMISLSFYEENYTTNNRANSVGKSFEEFVKDSFADSIKIKDKNKKNELQNTVFDYKGNNTNPPDAVLKGGNYGDAIEIKKIENLTSSLALNSSYPHHKIYIDSPMISKACKDLDNWSEKDLLYVIGSTDSKKDKKKKNNLKSIFMLYGLDYAADNDTYINIKNRLTNGINDIPNFDFSKTKELGRLNSIDPLGITFLRLRGMWGIENPVTLFSKDVAIDYYKNNAFSLVFVVNDDKWSSFNNIKEFMDFINKTKNLSIENIKIPDPNNPAKLKSGKLIKYFK